jgi:long-chain fatty acid transport protein
MCVALTKSLSVGATIGFDYNSNRLTAPYIFQSQPVLAGLKTLLDLHTNGWGPNVSVGMLAKPSRKVQVGLAGKSRTVIDSTGTATGNVGQQLKALGLAAPADFAYSAAVHNVLPQSVIGSVYWKVDPRWLLAFQTNWVNWNDAFQALPVALSNGTNPAISGLVTPLRLPTGFRWTGRIKSRFTAALSA